MDTNSLQLTPMQQRIIHTIAGHPQRGLCLRAVVLSCCCTKKEIQILLQAGIICKSKVKGRKGRLVLAVHEVQP